MSAKNFEYTLEPTDSLTPVRVKQVREPNPFDAAVQLSIENGMGEDDNSQSWTGAAYSFTVKAGGDDIPAARREVAKIVNQIRKAGDHAMVAGKPTPVSVRVRTTDPAEKAHGEATISFQAMPKIHRNHKPA